jgi:hypothetical protein
MSGVWGEEGSDKRKGVSCIYAMLAHLFFTLSPAWSYIILARAATNKANKKQRGIGQFCAGVTAQGKSAR